VELEELAAKLELNGPREDDEQFFRVAVRVGLGSRRSADLELAHEDLEVMERLRRQQQLPAEDAERERRSLAPPEDSRPRQAGGLEQVGDRHAERVRDAPQRSDARARPAALDLAQEAFAEARALRNRPQRAPPKPAKRPKALAD